MNRILLAIAGMFSAWSLMLVDAAVKGTLLLMLAGIVALLLTRNSAAIRHLVWVLAATALLVVPVFSALLPELRVLPGWTAMSPEPVAADVSPASSVRTADAGAEVALKAAGAKGERPFAPAHPQAAALPGSPPVLATAEIGAEPAGWSWNWITALPLVWAIGFSGLVLRLMAARWMLSNCERRCTVLGPAVSAEKATHDPIVTALEAGCLQLGIRRSVTLLIHSDKTMPMVWGILRCHLVLPAAARHWSGEQLRSVLMHELAHVKRRDTSVQLLTQIACALHWFNPLMWLAAWRLGVERERACDDLVLASGVRPSVYASHLLDVAASLAPARWTQACGLAMARKSSLEGRLVAVLSDRLNRRGVSATRAAVALAIAVGVAVPIAMLRAAEAKPGASAQQESQKPNDAAKLQPGAGKEGKGGQSMPKNEQAQTLFKMWQANARKNGDIPGGLVALLGDKVKEFVRNNTGDAGGDSYAKKMAPLLPRFDASQDWKPAAVVSLLDDIAAANTIPLETTLEEAERQTIRRGAPLPKELAGAPWGEAQAGGLRMAWLLEPRAAQHRLGTPLKSRILLCNSGKQPVVFRAPTWFQSFDHKAHDAKGAAINIVSTRWLTLSWVVPTRLMPGEFVEVPAVGIGIGANKNDEDWQHTNVGSWIEATAGNDVTFTPGAVPLRDESPPQKEEAGWWLRFIAGRLARELPLPAAADERTPLLDRVVRDLFGTGPTAEETAAFVADHNASALEALAKRLAQRPGLTPFSGQVQSGATTFRVLPVDPDAAKKPRTAVNPGHYTLGESAQLVVTRRPDGKRIVNEARIEFYSPDPAKPAPGKPYEIMLPDGYHTWAAAWQRGTTKLWVLQEGKLQSYDFSNPAQVKQTTSKEAGNFEGVPQPIQDALRAAHDGAGGSEER